MHPQITHASLGSPQSIPKLHLDGFSRFAQFTAEGPYTLHWATHFPLGPTVLSIRNGISTVSDAFCTAHGTESYTLQLAATSPPQNCSFAWCVLDPRLIHGSFGSPEFKTQMASRSVQSFLQGS